MRVTKVDYSSVTMRCPPYTATCEAHDALVLSVANALGQTLELTAVEARGPYGTHYNVVTTGLTFYFLLEHKSKNSLRLSVSPNYHVLKLSVEAHELKDRKPDTATFDLSRDPVKIAKDILRKVVEPYGDNMLALIERDRERRGAAGKRNAAVKQLCELFETRPHRCSGGHFTTYEEVGEQETLAVHCPQGVGGYRFLVTPGGYTTVERIHFNDPAKAVELAKFLLTQKETEEA